MRTFQRFVFIVVIALAVTGCDALYRTLDKEGAEEKDLIGDLIPFEKNVKVEEVQTLLELYGYDPGKVDGNLGLRTRDTIARFQRDQGLEETRFVDQATWEKLEIFRNYHLVVDNKLNIPLIQEILIAAGYDAGKVDGKPGRKTKNAIKKFQKDRGLKVDGKIGYKTLTELSKHLVFE